MNAKETAPLASTNVQATSAIRLRLFTLTSIDSRNTSTHIAHGLKPSSSSNE